MKAYIGSIDEKFPFVNTLVFLGDETLNKILLTNRKIHWRLIKHHVVGWLGQLFQLSKNIFSWSLFDDGDAEKYWTFSGMIFFIDAEL